MRRCQLQRRFIYHVYCKLRLSSHKGLPMPSHRHARLQTASPIRLVMYALARIEPTSCPYLGCGSLAMEEHALVTFLNLGRPICEPLWKRAWIPNDVHSKLLGTHCRVGSTILRQGWNIINVNIGGSINCALDSCHIDLISRSVIVRVAPGRSRKRKCWWRREIKHCKITSPSWVILRYRPSYKVASFGSKQCETSPMVAGWWCRVPLAQCICKLIFSEFPY